MAYVPGVWFNPSIIGAGTFHGSVRDGKRWGHAANDHQGLFRDNGLSKLYLSQSTCIHSMVARWTD